MVVWFTTLLLAVATTSVVPADLTHKDIAQLNLIKLQPRLVSADAARIYIGAKANTCGLPWQILAAIAFVESSLIKTSVGRLNKTTDFGLMQINEKTIRRYGFDKQRLMIDEAYAIQAGTVVLRDMYGFSRGKFRHWLGMYRFGTNRQRFRDRMKFYHNNVVRIAKRLGLPDSRLTCQ